MTSGLQEDAGRRTEVVGASRDTCAHLRVHSFTWRCQLSEAQTLALLLLQTYLRWASHAFPVKQVRLPGPAILQALALAPEPQMLGRVCWAAGSEAPGHSTCTDFEHFLGVLS